MKYCHVLAADWLLQTQETNLDRNLYVYKVVVAIAIFLQRNSGTWDNGIESNNVEKYSKFHKKRLQILKGKRQLCLSSVITKYEKTMINIPNWNFE